MNAVINEVKPQDPAPTRRGRPSIYVAKAKELLAQNPKLTVQEFSKAIGQPFYRSKLILAVAQGKRATIKPPKKTKRKKVKPVAMQKLRNLIVSNEPPKATLKVVLPSSGTLSISEVLDERGKSYGPFIGHARVTQAIKHAIFAHAPVLEDDQREALEMIAHKIGRIINGNPDYVDSWVDIAGYAQLVADRLNGKTR